MNSNPVDGKVDNSIACIFTMMLPGLGQLLKNEIIPGVIWSLVVGGGYLINGYIGLTFHVLCILDAALLSNNKAALLKSMGLFKRCAMFTGLSLLVIYTCLRTALF